ncbi:MAG: VOC family protein [Terriglobales bacterium]
MLDNSCTERISQSKGGFVKLNPYLNFNGQCEAAFKFYEKCLGAKIASTFPFKDSPMAKDVPAEWQSKLMHATLNMKDEVLMGADAPPGRYSKPQGFSVSIGLKDVAQSERIFRALAEGGTVQMPIQETFWAARFGMLTDQFGIPWMINCEKAV